MFSRINKIAVFLTAALIIISIAVFNLTLNNTAPKINAVKVNEILNEVKNHTGDFEDFSFNNGIDFVVTDGSGKFLYGTKGADGLSYEYRINLAIKNNSIVLTFSGGQIFIETAVNNVFNSQRQKTKTVFYVFVSVIIVLMAAYYLFLYLKIVKPFNSLKSFAANIAMGKLDTPVIREKDNYFGEFTSSFDIMREELKKSQLKAAELEKSKKELIAQLSHDIKTPLASIKALSELMAVKISDEKTLKNVGLISQKTGEIDRLVSDLFSATLEELTQLNVDCREYESRELKDIITQADTTNKIEFLNGIPECLIVFDYMRLRQVFDNIISNSYKYADTKIEVSFICKDSLEICVKDFGKGVENEELALLSQKFYRGGNSGGVAGSGLGLNIASTFMEKMGGGLEFENLQDGFLVRVIIKLA